MLARDLCNQADLAIEMECLERQVAEIEVRGTNTRCLLHPLIDFSEH